ncbi:MAG: formylglycine-generating enzyme family protein, partial [Rhodanobacter sp.]
MPSNTALRRQRALGGAVGVLVLGFALTYHFFPGLFHVAPSVTVPRSMSLGQAVSPSPAVELAPAMAEVNAGPPLILAPASVIAARKARSDTHLPEQMSEDPPAVRALLERAAKALHTGRLVGDKDSAAALFEQALESKPDSRRATQGLFDVRARLVAEIGQSIAVGDADGASELLEALRTLPSAADEVAQLEVSLANLMRMRPMLVKGAELLAQGKADQPRGESALDIYREVQKLDPQNAVAEQGIFQVQRVVLDRALAAVAQNDFAGADRSLTQAGQIRPGSQQLRDVSKRVYDMRQQRANGLLAQAHSALDAGNVAMAKKLAGQARVIDPELSALAQFDQQLVNAQLYASYAPGQVFDDRYVDLPGKAPAMVVIPVGSFQMGSPASETGRSDAETPHHAVTIT